MKIAHLILAHNHPTQLDRLVKRIVNEQADVYIHLDKKTDITPFVHLEKLANVFFVKERVVVKWGEYSVIKATLEGMKAILATKITYTHINLLSGNDYPLKSNDTIQQYLFANSGKSFMWFDRIFNDWPEGQLRCNKYDFGDYGFPGRYQLTKLSNTFLPNRKPPYKLVPHGRSQWLTITPTCAEYVLNYLNNHSKAANYFRLTWCVDEIFFQTILCNSPLSTTLINNNLRHIPIDNECRPYTFTSTDVTELKASGKFYARKFDFEKDETIFNLLDED